jgi:hypothetical protein
MPPLDERDPLHPDNFDGDIPIFRDTAKLAARMRARNWRVVAPLDYLQWFDSQPKPYRSVLAFVLRHPALLVRLHCTCGRGGPNPLRLHPWQWEDQCPDCRMYREEEAIREHDEAQLAARIQNWARKEFRAA